MLTRIGLLRKNRAENRKLYKGFTTSKELHSGVLRVCASLGRKMENKDNNASRFQKNLSNGFSFSFCLRGDL